MLKHGRIFLALLVLLAGIPLAARAEGGPAVQKPADFPRRPIEITVVYPAGGGMDVTARTLARYAEKYVGQRLIVVNRVGAAGLEGHRWMAKQAPKDGYAVGVLANTLFPDILVRQGPFSIDEFDPIVSITFSPVFWVVNAQSKFGKMAPDEFIRYAIEHPGEIRMGMMPDNAFEFLTLDVERKTGARFTKIPFQGGAPGVTALLGNHIDATNAYIVEFEQYVRTGQLKPVAVANDVRHPKFPDVPTFAELGIPVAGNLWGAWRFVSLPPGVPEDRVRFLEAAFLAALNDPECQKAFEELGDPVMPVGAAETRRRFREAFERLRQFLADIGRLPAQP